jgi:hypothetical protein
MLSSLPPSTLACFLPLLLLVSAEVVAAIVHCLLCCFASLSSCAGEPARSTM